MTGIRAIINEKGRLMLVYVPEMTAEGYAVTEGKTFPLDVVVLEGPSKGEAKTVHRNQIKIVAAA